MAKTLIIGGIAGGATTATRLRRRDEEREIIIFERGAYISYANCGLPYYIGEVIENRSALLVSSVEIMKERFNIDVRTLNEVTKILPEEQEVEVKNLQTGETVRETYDDLVISTGSTPLKPPIPGIDAENIYTLWTIPDMDRIKEQVDRKEINRAAIIGGGFIGVEMAENLQRLGMDVTMIERADQVMAPLDFDMAQLIHENIRMNGVDLVLGDGVDHFATEGQVTTVALNSGRAVAADIVILAIGLRPNTELLKDTGIQLRKNRVVVDEQMQTSIPHIYACGDIVEIEHFLTKERSISPLAGPANKQARIVADNLSGDGKPYHGAMNTSITKVFDLDAASTGLNEKQLLTMGKVKNEDYYSVVITQKAHAGYYPDATPIMLKMLFDKEGHIFGAQIVGQEGVDKRIDVMSTAMRMGATIYDLTELELAYAPPFSSAKDPINMLGFVAENVLAGLTTPISWDEVDKLEPNEVTLLDISTDVERVVYEMPGSVHIPLEQLRNRLDELNKDKLIVVHCNIGVRGYTAERLLRNSGFKQVRNLSGGKSFYQSMHHKIEVQHTGGSGKVTQSDTTQVPAGDIKSTKIIDCCGLQCPGPIMQVYKNIEAMNDGDILEVSATDMGFARDVASWCGRTGNTLLKTAREGKRNIVYIQKGLADSTPAPKAEGAPSAELPQGKTMVVFSGDMDRVMASLIIANGAAAMGRKVTMFYTFWGLNALRKAELVRVKKSRMEAMFSGMMPRGLSKLKISNMNMGGMGTRMMKRVMRDKNVHSLEELMEQAMANGVKMVACTMSMDVMGITEEELIDGVELGGVAAYLGDAEMANVNLFI